jgi:hypothetical protein
VNATEQFVGRVIGLMAEKSKDPVLAAKLREIPTRRKILVAIYERSACLQWADLGGKRVRIPDAASTRGQDLYAYTVSVGAGELVAVRQDRSRIPNDIEAVVYLSAPVLGALVLGTVQGQAGPQPYDGSTAFKNGDLDAVGLDLTELLGITEALNALVVRVRGEILAGWPAAPAATTPPPAVASYTGPRATVLPLEQM